MNEDFKQLRKFFDGDELFMSAHQPKKERARERNVPDWALRDNSLQKILLAAFPLLKTNYKQRKAAARWASIIHLHYRMEKSYSAIAEVMNISIESVRMTVKRVRWVAAGRTANNTTTRKGSRGRPKKEVR